MTEPKNPGHRWKKGQPSANPHGRPRTGLALAEKIRERMDPQLVIDLALKVAADETMSASARLRELLPVYQMGFARPPDRHEVVSLNIAPIEARRVLDRLDIDTLRRLTDAAEAEQLEANQLAAGDPDDETH